MDVYRMEPMVPEEAARCRVPMLTGCKKRAVRKVTSALLDRGMLTSASYRASSRLGFPLNVAERCFPRLYPAGIGRRV